MMIKKILFISITLFILFICSVSCYAATREECIWAIVSQSNIDYKNSNEDILNRYIDGENIEEEWRKPFVAAALENNIIYGYEDNTLKLNKEVSRAEFACMLYRAEKFYDAPPIEKIKYQGKYTDISDWNEKEIYYCIENGYLMGYGNKFGSDDTITKEQLNIVIKRVKMGLTTREKYSLFEVCGISPVSMKEILNSAYNDELKNISLPGQEAENVLNENDTGIALKLETLMEMQGNLDPLKFKNEDYKNSVLENFYSQGPMGIKYYTKISENNSSKTIIEKIDECKKNNIKRESIFIFSPFNNKNSIFATAYERTVASGYEYYCYQDTTSDTPNGEKVGVWYKRRVDVDYTQYKTVSTPYAELKCNYGEPEEL